MSRVIVYRVRPCVVWLAATLATVAAWLSVPATWTAARGAAGTDAVAALLVAGCATVLAASLAWLWVITTAAAADLLRGRAASGGGATRRLVLLACGAAVVTATGAPAHAADGDGAELLAGLPLPERAVAPAVPERRSVPPATARPASAEHDSYVVRPGDTLWSIAVSHPGAGRDVDARWRAIWSINRDVVGADPDLILPGQSLRLPAGTTHSPDTDGAR